MHIVAQHVCHAKRSRGSLGRGLRAEAGRPGPHCGLIKEGGAVRERGVRCGARF